MGHHGYRGGTHGLDGLDHTTIHFDFNAVATGLSHKSPCVANGLFGANLVTQIRHVANQVNRWGAATDGRRDRHHVVDRNGQCRGMPQADFGVGIAHQ